LVTLQVTVSLLLLIAGGLFGRTLWNLHRVDAGFRGNGVLVVNADGAREGYRGASSAAFYEGLLQQVERLPGVQSASYSLITPLAGGGISHNIAVKGQAESHEIYFNSISRGYFKTMGTAVLLGREFTPRDTADAGRVAVVNQAFARRYLAAGSPLGQRLTVSSHVYNAVLVAHQKLPPSATTRARRGFTVMGALPLALGIGASDLSFQ
jgi:putative ABC transport system permease protein